MNGSNLRRCTIGATTAAFLLALAGCGAVASAPATTGVCYASNGKIDPNIVRESDCYQAGGSWESPPK